jgi:hypothetical protein
MSKTQAEKEAFLRSTDRKVILIELQYHDGTSSQTEYFANATFWSRPGDAISNQTYDDAIIQLPRITERIDDDASFGSLTIFNHSDYSDWLSYSFDGWPIKILIGSADWSRDDFFEIFNGITGGIGAPSSDRLAIRFFDKREKLRVDFQRDNFYDDGTPYPVCIGPVFNGTARMIDKATYKFRYHENGNLTVANVRDHGVDLGSAFTDNGDGTFTLSSAPVDSNGANITFDVTTGETDGTIDKILEFLVLRSDLTASDIDSVSLSAFSSSAILARYVDQRTSIQSLIREAERSVNARARFNLEGKLELVKRFEIPSSQVLDFDEDDMINRGLRLRRSIKPLPLVRFSYARNETVQNPGDLAGAVSDSDREIYTSPYQVVSTSNAGVSTVFPETEPELLVETWHTQEAEAQSECDHLAAFYSEKRSEFVGEFIASPFLLSVGDGASLEIDKLGFGAGKDIVITGKRLRLDSRRTELEFIV